MSRKKPAIAKPQAPLPIAEIDADDEPDDTPSDIARRRELQLGAMSRVFERRFAELHRQTQEQHRQASEERALNRELVAERVERAGQAFSGVLAPTDYIVSHGGRCYEFRGIKKTVSAQADAVLQPFLKQGSMDTKQLNAASGYTDAPKVLSRLTKRYDGLFSPAIDLPGNKSGGGYAVRIRLAASDR